MCTRKLSALPQRQYAFLQQSADAVTPQSKILGKILFLAWSRLQFKKLNLHPLWQPRAFCSVLIWSDCCGSAQGWERQSSYCWLESYCVFVDAAGSTTCVLLDPHKYTAKMHYLKSFFFFSCHLNKHIFPQICDRPRASGSTDAQ